MKKSLFVPIVAILSAAAILLAASFALNNVAEKTAQKKHLELMQTLLPDSKSFLKEAYDGEDTNIRTVHKGDSGFVIETVTAGYADDIRMLIGVNNDGKVTGLVILDMAETFGLGATALTDHEFLSQFLNTSGEASVGGDIDAISGATVTSKAIVRSVNSAVAYVTGADADSAATSWGG